MSQGYEPSTRETERILYAYPQLRAYAQVVETQGSGSVVTLGEDDRRASDPVHQAVLKREILTDVVRTVDCVLRALPQEEQEIIERRYFLQHPWEKVVRETFLSRATVFRRRDAAIPRFSKAFAILGPDKLRRFWDYFETLVRLP